MHVLTIKKSDEFGKISKKNTKFYSKTILLLSSKTPDQYFFNKTEGKNSKEFSRLGLTVSKKVGNAVFRNKAKRRLREAFKELAKNAQKNNILAGNDYVLIAKKEVSSSSYKEIVSNLKFCLKGLKRFSS